MIEHIRDRINTMFSDLIFDDRRHLYYVGGVNYPSVTTMIKQHEEPVDFESKLPYCAIRENTTVDELRKKWSLTREQAQELGHETHYFLEDFTGLETPKSPQEKAGVKFFKDILKEYEIVYRELRCYSRRYKFAGTMDLLLRNRITGKLVIADYKTNPVEKLFKAYGFLLTPFDTLESHPFNKYQIQLSYYDLMLDEIGLYISERILVNLREDEEYKIYPTYDLKPEIHSFLNTVKPQANLLW